MTLWILTDDEMRPLTPWKKYFPLEGKEGTPSKGGKAKSQERTKSSHRLPAKHSSLFLCSAKCLLCPSPTLRHPQMYREHIYCIYYWGWHDGRNDATHCCENETSKALHKTGSFGFRFTSSLLDLRLSFLKDSVSKKISSFKKSTHKSHKRVRQQGETTRQGCDFCQLSLCLSHRKVGLKAASSS